LAGFQGADVGFEQLGHGAARRALAIADAQHFGDLGQGQAQGLGERTKRNPVTASWS
jgi:hypothetical protein